MSAQAQGSSLVGRVINGHEVVRVLGEGGMGEVYIARHQQLGTLRALKVIHDDIKSNPSIAKRFKREAMVLGRLQHPNIVSVIEYGQLDNGWPFLLLEYVDGSDLHRMLEHGAMSVVPAVELLLQLARVLTYAHGQGVVHRDLKPANVLVRAGDHRQPKVIDFGLAKLVSAEMLTRLTAAQQIMGSPHYMAPEQAFGAVDIGPPADVYALAGIAYQALSGQPVFGDRPMLALICAQMRETPARLSTRVGVPRRLDDLLYHCLAKDPAHRPTTTQLVTELEALLIEVGGRSFDVVPGVITPVAFPAGTPPPVHQTPPPQQTPPPPELAADARSFIVSSPPLVPTAPSQQLVLSKSMLGEQQVMTAADFIFSPLPSGDARRVREAMQRQMLAILGELSQTLATRDADMASRRSSVEAIESDLGALELDVAMVESEIAAATSAADDVRIALEEQRTELARRTLALRRRLDSELRELAVVIEYRRRAAPSEAVNLYRELDDLIGRARSFGGSR